MDDASAQCIKDSEVVETLAFLQEGVVTKGAKKLLDDSMANKKARTRLTILQKYNLIRDVQNHMPRVEVMKKYNLKNQSNISIIMKNQIAIVKHVQNTNSSNSVKSLKTTPYRDIEEALVKWAQDWRAKNKAITRELLKSKAEIFGQMLGHVTFKASNGFVDKMRARTGICHRSGIVSGKNDPVDQEVVREWKDNLPSLVSGYGKEDIFNADEMAILWKLPPRGDVRKALRKQKDRLTLLLIVNASGTEKDFAVIGTAVKPKAFKRTSPPCRWYSNKSAWMTATIFATELDLLNDKMKLQNRSILLFVDTCAVHNLQKDYSNIHVVYFPANCTSAVQPVEQGLVRSVKSKYRQQIVESLLNDVSLDRLTVLDAIIFLISAVNEQSQSVIVNCFTSTGFYGDGEGVRKVEEEPYESTWEEARQHVTDLAFASFEEYVNADNGMESVEELSDDSIINSIKEKEEANSDSESDAEAVISTAQAIKNLRQLKRYVALNKFGDQAIMNLCDVEKVINTMRNDRFKLRLRSNVFTPKYC